MKLCWIDVRPLQGPVKAAVLEEAVHQRVDAIVTDDIADLSALPPTVKKVLLLRENPIPEDLTGAEIVVVDTDKHGSTAELTQRYPEVQWGRYVEIVDADSLEQACRSGLSEAWSVLDFRDPTKIPLEIVIAAAIKGEGSLITVAKDVEESQIIFGVLELGSDGVMLAPVQVGETTQLVAAAAEQSPDLALTELTVTGIQHVGMGERACVDTCSYLGKDEGILVGSHSKGMILCVSETHPLPYMPTRPFRVNAGAIHSYTLGKGGRTNYLSELVSGSRVTAVDITGKTRIVTVGRVKIESRPLLQISAVAPDGREVDLILQDDWHVRVLGPGGMVLNSTHIEPGDKVLGYLPTEDRHVGYPINEFCREQ
ncbi:3-dehydroquinate synthase II [Actinacidiphila paucisporea]|uniref:3-amino-4-hydroxybenzoic acid synthase n=1 Tax=Actinacidiphila paucisporea TaxID=310782 RepID=A0A1M7Q7P0_9ACTN|nr:3-dehydroquinate synthase II [Actinacidiphila paucisporea]SHN26585.1 3-amino-4-hydroxybenzoic acid synthase [Actinacidiphila paucisporea]